MGKRIEDDPEMNLCLYIVRGLSGSGKTTLAHTIASAIRGKVFEADDFFMANGVYAFDPNSREAAHHQCKYNVNMALVGGVSCVVSNTFSCRWEFEPYIHLAEEWNARCTVLDLFDQGLTDEELAERSCHGVPISVIQRMRKGWEHDWKSCLPYRVPSFSRANQGK
tara:strand:+ start:263 stop:760 length:498 start_codon:yes stop_codon:yes gene_type:complete